MKTVLFQLDTLSLLRELQSSCGFVMSPEAAKFVGTSNNVGGDPLARKGDLFFGIEIEKHVVRLRGPDPTAVRNEWKSVIELVESRFEMDMSRAWFFEFQTSLHASASADPTVVFSNGATNELMKGAAAVFGRDTGLFGLRFSTPKDPNDADWFEVRIEPSLRAATREYSLNVVFRSAQRKDVDAFVESIDHTLSELIDLVERDHK
jgi:hypothetical protein